MRGEREIRSGVLVILLTVGSPGLAAGQVELVSRAPARLAPDTAGGPSFISTAVPQSAVSTDGRYFVFVSHATNLVRGQIDTNGEGDVFLHDRVTGTTTLVSHVAGSPNTTGDQGAGGASLSADGRFVAFASAARNLLADAEDDEGFTDVFLYERATGEITRVTRSADGSSDTPRVSADGSFIAFISGATDLVPEEIGDDTNVYLYEKATGTTLLVSRSAASPGRSADGISYNHALSADGRFVAFLSNAGDLVAGQIDTGGHFDVFLFDRTSRTTTLLSRESGSAVRAGNGFASAIPSFSADGQLVAFASTATNLVAGARDTNRRDDVFLYDRLLGTVTWISRSTPRGGFQPTLSADGNAVAYFDADPQVSAGQIHVFDRPTGRSARVAPAAAGSLALSRDGRFIAFVSGATNLVRGQQDTPRTSDVFLHDRSTGTTVLVSHAAPSLTRAGNDHSFGPLLSPDGSWVAYSSRAGNLAADKQDTNAQEDVFLYERATARNRVVSLHAPGLASLTPLGRSKLPAISGDGRFVAFVNDGAGLFPGHVDTNGENDVFLFDRVTKTTTLVSRSRTSPLRSANAGSAEPRVSRNGNFVAFVSRARDLVAGQVDPGNTFDTFVYNRLTRTVRLVSRSSRSPVEVGNASSFPFGVTDTGLVVFNSQASNLVAGQVDPNNDWDVFFFDPGTGIVTLLSHAHGSASRTGNGFSFATSMSPDGTFIGFYGFASDLTPAGEDANGRRDAFLVERRSRAISRLSRNGGELPLVSADGRYAAFLGIPPESPGESEVIFLDRTTGTSLQVARTLSILPLFGLSDDGRHLLFASNATDLVPGQQDDPFTADLFLFDRVSGETRLVSHVPGDPTRAAGAVDGRLSADGRLVAFRSASEALQPEPQRFRQNIFLYDRTSQDVTLVSRSVLSPPQAANGESEEFVLSAFGGFVAFVSRASDLIRRDFNGDLADVFLYGPTP